MKARVFRRGPVTGAYSPSANHPFDGWKRFGLLPLRGIGRKTEILAGSVKRNRNVRLKRLVQLKRHFVQEIDAVFFVETLHCLVDALFCFTIFTEKFAQTIHRHIIFFVGFFAMRLSWREIPCYQCLPRDDIKDIFFEGRKTFLVLQNPKKARYLVRQVFRFCAGNNERP